jgi:hypothetical protein
MDIQFNVEVPPFIPPELRSNANNDRAGRAADTAE